MKLFQDVELVFSDVYIQKPVKTLKINTTAPIQVQNNECPCSSGVATFSAIEAFSDRFIVWRAIGQKLYLEERSICRTVTNGALCMDFGRTSIVPGTYMTIEKFLFCLVVPTQSGVHRFTCRLVSDPMDELNIEVKSIFSQINERDFLGDSHYSVMLTTPGEVKKAKVLTERSKTKVAYCMQDGQLVLISLPPTKKEKWEEIILRDGGLISKLMSSAAATFACDVEGCITPRGEAVFYALYKDGSLKIWNVDEGKTSQTIQLTKLIPTSDLDQAQISLRVNYVKGQTLIVLAIHKIDKTVFHCFVEQSGRMMSLVYTTIANFKGKLCDFQLVFNSSPKIQLYALWSSSETPTIHTLAYTILEEAGRRNGWIQVEDSRVDSAKYDTMMPDELKECIFDADKRSFDIVLRAVQITCDGSNCEVVQNDWKALATHVDNYMQFPDNPKKYRERAKSKRLSTKENEFQFEKKFLSELASNCDQLEEESRVPLSMFMIDVKGACLTGVILKEHFTVVCAAADRLDITMKKSFEELINYLPDPTKPEDERKVNKILAMVGEDVLEKCRALVRRVLDDADFEPKSPSNLSSFPFRGKFTASLTAAMIRQYVGSYLEFTNSMLRFRKILQNTEIKYFEGSNMILVEKLEQFHWGLQFIQTMFDIKMQLKSNVTSLGTWLFLANDFATIRCEGSADTNINLTEKMDYNWFLDTTVKAAFRALWPNTSSLVACRLLADHFKWNTLYKLCQEYLRIPAFSGTFAIQYYLALSYSGSNHPHKALTAFQECFNGVEREEEALMRALRQPGASLSPPVTLGEVYAHVIKFLSDQNHSEEVVALSKNAIDVLPDDDPFKNKIYATLFNLLVKKGVWHDALETIKKNRDTEMRRATLLEFITRLLKARDWKTIISLHYGGLEQQVENILLTSARSQEVEINPHLFELLYSYYMAKCRFNKAAQIMLEYAIILKQATQTKDLLKRRRDVLAAVDAIFELVDQKDRFAYFPQEKLVEEEIPAQADDVDMDVDAFQNTSRVVTKRTTLIIDEKAVQSEWTVTKARLVILDDGMTPPIEEVEILKQLIHKKHYDEAFDICREFNLDPSDMFFALTSDTILLDLSKYADTPRWSLTNRRHVGRSVSNNWSILKGILAAARVAWPEDSRPYRAITLSLLSHDVNIPCWLQFEYAEFDIGDYTRCLVDYNQIQAAVDCLVTYIKKEAEKIIDVDVNTVLPYAVINDIFHSSNKIDNGSEIILPLNKSLESYLARISAFESAQRFGS